MIFEYLYYRFYLVGSMIGYQNNPPAKGTYLFLMFQITNLASIIIAPIKFGCSLPFEVKTIHGIILAFLLIFLNERFLLKRHKIISVKYENESDLQKNKGYWVLAIYVCISIISLLMILYW